jgi:hypothetical protein
MRKLIATSVCALILSASAYAHTAFRLVSSEKKLVTASQLGSLVKEQASGKIDGSNITYDGSQIRLVVTTGPEDDMLSYRIQGVRNPNIVIKSGALIKLIFINVDADMRHDIRFGHAVGEFALTTRDRRSARAPTSSTELPKPVHSVRKRSSSKP